MNWDLGRSAPFCKGSSPLKNFPLIFTKKHEHFTNISQFNGLLLSDSLSAIINFRWRFKRASGDAITDDGYERKKFLFPVAPRRIHLHLLFGVVNSDWVCDLFTLFPLHSSTGRGSLCFKRAQSALGSAWLCSARRCPACARQLSAGPSPG